MDIFEKKESNVRTYCRTFRDVFVKAKGSLVYADSGAEFIDFFAGAGVLNYGHNNDFIQQRLIDYLKDDGIQHALDMHTGAKREFLEKFDELVLKPRSLDYKVQFCGPTGTNGVEAALKLARKVTGRTEIVAFRGAYHGVSLGSLAATGDREKRSGAGQPLQNVTFFPYADGCHVTFDTVEFLEGALLDSQSGLDVPAAVILETVQAEGGVYVAPSDWLQRLARLCRDREILLICDDVQVGCGRTGPFFSFERAGIEPDMVILSKSIGGYGGPMSLLLMRPGLDVWSPGEHNGTFRGHQLSLVGASAALEFREAHDLEAQVERKAQFLSSFLRSNLAMLQPRLMVRGIGMIWGVDLSQCGGTGAASAVAERCYELGLLVERAGRDGSVLKILPPLTIEPELLERGCGIVRQALTELVAGELRTRRQESGRDHAAIIE